jgi:hypothetical protein
MKAGTPFRLPRFFQVSAVVTIFTVSLAILSAGCGSGTSTPPHPVLHGNTAVTLLLSSTANAQLSQFEMSFNSITLANAAGKTVSLVNTLQGVEFIHLNGRTEALLTTTIPQDVYTSATADIAPALFTCATLIPSTGGLAVSMYGYGYVPANQVTVNIPAPITVTGSVMGLQLNLQVSKSATFPTSCYTTDIEPWSIDPTFDLTAVSFASPVVEPSMDGRIASVDPSSNSFTITLAGGQGEPGASRDGQTLTMKTNSGTLYQGLSGLSMLSVGTYVDMDAAIQTDGSQLATRIEVEDPAITDLSASTGPVLQTNTVWPVLFGFERQSQGYLTDTGQAAVGMYFSFGNAAFQISERLGNLQSLPFVPTFTASNVFAGQNVYLTSQATTYAYGPTYIPLNTVTLMPQTINGTLAGTSTDAGFTTYTVALAAYDLIPTLAVQQGQTTVLNDPNNIVVYVDSNTQKLNTQPLTVGSAVRFSGLLFNDNGTMRMDCSQINDGVAVQPVANAARSRALLPGEQRIISSGVFDRNHVSQPLVVLHQRFGSGNFFPAQKVH